jgi:hypothetical protein
MIKQYVYDGDDRIRYSISRVSTYERQNVGPNVTKGSMAFVLYLRPWECRSYY